MKKLLLIVIAAVVFIGCSKKDTPNPTPVNAATIVGKWYFNADTTRDYKNDVLQEIDTESYSHTAYIQFNADKSGGYFNTIHDGNFTYTEANGTITITIPQKANDGTPEPPLVQTATIKHLTSSNLNLETVTIFTFGAGTVYREVSETSYNK